MIMKIRSNLVPNYRNRSCLIFHGQCDHHLFTIPSLGTGWITLISHSLLVSVPSSEHVKECCWKRSRILGTFLVTHKLSLGWWWGDGCASIYAILILITLPVGLYLSTNVFLRTVGPQTAWLYSGRQQHCVAIAVASSSFSGLSL